MKRLFLLLFLSFAVLGGFRISSCYAAEIPRVFAEPVTVSVQPGAQAIFSVFLRVPDAINALEGRLVFPKDLLEVKQIREGNSFLNFWIEKPTLSDQTVTFSGIVPGGFSGPRGLVLTFVVSGLHTGKGTIVFQQGKAFYHDGLGTDVALANFSLPAEVSSQAKAVDVQSILADQDVPEPFTIQLSRDTNLNDGAWTAVFATQDKGSGIDHYAVFESKEQVDPKTIDPRSWVVSDGTYLLQDQTRKNFVYVRAIDRSGNERLAVLSPLAMPWYGAWWFYVIIFFVFDVVIYLIFRLRRR